MAGNNDEYAKYFFRRLQACEEYKQSLSESKTFYKILDYLRDLNLPFYFNDGSEIVDLLKVKRSVILGTKKLLEGVDLDVPIVEYEIIKRIVESYHPLETQQRLALDEVKMGSIFDIPVKFGTEKNSTLSSYRCREVDYRTSICSYIELENIGNSKKVEANYSHELGHALARRNVDTVINPFMNEYIPMMFEFLYLLGCDEKDALYRERCIDRLRERQKYDVLAFSNDMDYLVSLLLTIVTLERYREMTPKYKEEIESEFKRVLNGEWSLDKFLNEFELNLTSGKSLRMVNRTIERIHC